MPDANNQVIDNLKNSIKNLIIPYELTLTSDKETISSNDNESTIITAVLTSKKTGLPVQDELLLYTIYDSDYNLLDHGVLTTNNNGEASVVYVASGVGDVNVTFSLRTVLQKTYVIEDWLFNPPLDGTDNITLWSNLTNKTENGIFTSHGSFLTDGWSNKGNWILDFDVRCTDWTYVGLMMFCDARINPFTDAKNVNYSYTTWEGLNYGGGFGATIISQTSMSKINNSNWHHYTITKLSDTQIEIVIDKKYTAVVNVPNLINAETLHIGSRDNQAGRNYGGLVNLKNIKVKAL